MKTQDDIIRETLKAIAYMPTEERLRIKSLLAVGNGALARADRGWPERADPRWADFGTAATDR